MDSAKSLSKPDSGRRSFLRKAGVAMSAAVAAAVPGVSKSEVKPGDDSKDEADRLSRRIAILEDENSIRALHQNYESFLDGGRYEEVVDLFAEDAAVVFNGGVFKGRQDGLSRLYCERFRAGLTGKKIGPAPGFEVDPGSPQGSIKVSADRLSAEAQFPYSMQIGAPMALDSQLVQMARLQGEGIMKWCESGVCAISYSKDVKGGGWKIARLEYRLLSQTDYKPGKSYARTVSISPFAETYPKDPVGPDALIVPA